MEAPASAETTFLRGADVRTRAAANRSRGRASVGNGCRACRDALSVPRMRLADGVVMNRDQGAF